MRKSRCLGQLVSVVLISLLFACTKPQNGAMAQFRVGQFMWTSGKTDLEFYRNEKKVASLHLSYGTLSEYKSLPSDTYLIKVSHNGKPVLKKRLGLGTDGSYTLYLTGIEGANEKMGEQSTMNILHTMVEGAEAQTPNAYLPQLKVLNDYFIPEPGKATVRIVHLMPGTVPLETSMETPQGKKVTFGKIGYPKHTKSKAIAQGKSRLKIFLPGNRTGLIAKSMELENGKLYTFFIHPEPGRYLTTPCILKAESTQPEN